MADGLVRVGAVSKAGSAGGTPPYTQDVLGNLVTTDAILNFLMRGVVFVAGDADENDLVVGQTSYAATTPTFLLRVPSGTTAIPLWIDVKESTTAAGGDIQAYVSFDRIDRYSSGGTSEAITAMRTDRIAGLASSTLYSGATAAAASDARTLWSAGDIPTTAGSGTAVTTNNLIGLVAFKNFMPPVLVGPAALLVFTWSGTTGPSFAAWSIGWAEFSSGAVAQS